MKTILPLVLSFFSILFSYNAMAQSKAETVAVAGACGMCKSKIEKAAKAAGATYALWNVDSKKLAVKYNTATANAAKIQQHIATAGYDTPTAKATDSAYNSLHECCKYELMATAESCCSNAACTDKDCCAGAVCEKDAACCTQEKDPAAAGQTASVKETAGCCVKH